MKSEERLWKPFNDGSVQSNFSTYPLMLVCEVASNEINITAFYDKSIMSSWEVERMMLQLDCILQQLNSAADGNTLNVGDIQTFSRQDKELVKSWNKNELEVTDRCLHHAFEQHAVSQPGATALSSWDGDLTYHELREHANRLAQYLVSVGIRQETFVPICMDRGKWVIISILAILMTGAAYVPLDPKSPLSRQEGIIHDINAKIALCSPEYGDRFDGFVQTIVIDERILNRLEGLPSRMVALASSNSPSYGGCSPSFFLLFRVILGGLCFLLLPCYFPRYTSKNGNTDSEISLSDIYFRVIRAPKGRRNRTQGGRNVHLVMEAEDNDTARFENLSFCKSRLRCVRHGNIRRAHIRRNALYTIRRATYELYGGFHKRFQSHMAFHDPFPSERHQA